MPIDDYGHGSWRRNDLWISFWEKLLWEEGKWWRKTWQRIKRITILLRLVCQQGLMDREVIQSWSAPFTKHLHSAYSFYCFYQVSNFLWVSLGGHGEVFVELDLPLPYQQLLFGYGISDIQPIVCHQVNCQVACLPFGISVAFGVFHSFVKTLVSRIRMRYHISAGVMGLLGVTLDIPSISDQFHSLFDI